MDTITTNSGNTLDKAINITYNLYTSFKNDSILINYGDSSTQNITVNSGNSCLKFYFSFKKFYLF
jgi:hypothetical protein